MRRIWDWSHMMRRAGLPSLAMMASAGLAVAIGATAFGQQQQQAPQSQIQTRSAMRDIPASFADLAEAKLPAVVNISTKQQVPAERVPGLPQLPPGSPLEEFFRDFFGGLPESRPRQLTALGSGFIISADGYIVTNNHVIENATEITVLLQDDTELQARLVGRDPPTDLALLKVEVEKPLPFVEWGDSTALRIGDWVLAIGNPFGLGGSVTAGIISARARDIKAGPYDDFLQTDASINRGNSGGPLFAMDGHVVGVNTAIFSPTGGNIGIGFAIPSAIAANVVQQLRENGTVQRGWLGVRLQPITPEIAQALNLQDRKGALVADVTRDSPAAKAGLEPGDVIIEFNGKPIADGRELARMVGQMGPGTRADLTVLRTGQRVTRTVELGRLRDAEAQAQTGSGDQQVSPTSGQLGLQLSPLTPALRERFGISEETEGVIVMGVAPGSVAAERGVMAGDVILRVGQQKVGTPQEVIAQVEEARKQKRQTVLMLVQRQNSSLFVPLPVDRARG